MQDQTRKTPGVLGERWLSVDEITAHLGVARDTVYRWIDRKGMPAHRVGKLWKFKASEVDEWVRSGGAQKISQRRSPAARARRHKG